MVDQFLHVKQPHHLRVAALGVRFSSHHSVCGTESMPISQTWFQLPSNANPHDVLDTCFHPNERGAEAIADAIVEQVHVMMSASVAPAPTQASSSTWTASVQVALCVAPPNSGREMNCHGEAGVVVTITLASGEVLGSCTSGEPVQFPGGDMISLCSVDGLPFNVDFVASQDPATIPAGYEPYSNSLSLHVDNLIPGGGDQATFTFFDVRADAGSTGSVGTSRSNRSEAATHLANNGLNGVGRIGGRWSELMGTVLRRR